MKHLSVIVALFVAGCRSEPLPAPQPPAPPPLGPITIPDVTVYLAQARCPDGTLTPAEPGCLGAAPQRASDPMLMRRHDLPAPDGFQASDSFVSDDGTRFVATWSYPPYGPFTIPNGDGGEFYVRDGSTVRIAATEDGSQPTVQVFTGADCGGTGWVLFRADAPTGRWAEMVASLNDEPVGGACSAAIKALTRYRLEQVTFPFVSGGVATHLTLPTVISEHYNEADFASARSMERTFMSAGVGRVMWEAWTMAPPVGADLAHRCPGSNWSRPPGPGWSLSDCRTSTNMVVTDGSLTGDSYGWPPKGLVLP